MMGEYEQTFLRHLSEQLLGEMKDVRARLDSIMESMVKSAEVHGRIEIRLDQIERRESALSGEVAEERKKRRESVSRVHDRINGLNDRVEILEDLPGKVALSGWKRVGAWVAGLIGTGLAALIGWLIGHFMEVQ